jgi:hypothetical protein
MRLKMIWWLALSCITSMAFGCGKKTESNNAASVLTAPAPATGDSTASQASPVVQSEPGPPATAGEPVAPDLSPLTQALHIYVYQHKKMPNTFAELVTAGYVKKIPPLPPGKKLEISPATAQIIMINQ